MSVMCAGDLPRRCNYGLRACRLSVHWVAACALEEAFVCSRTGCAAANLSKRKHSGMCCPLDAASTFAMVSRLAQAHVMAVLINALRGCARCSRGGGWQHESGSPASHGLCAVGVGAGRPFSVCCWQVSMLAHSRSVLLGRFRRYASFR